MEEILNIITDDTYNVVNTRITNYDSSGSVLSYTIEEKQFPVSGPVIGLQIIFVLAIVFSFIKRR